jgi:hypothetical protein
LETSPCRSQPVKRTSRVFIERTFEVGFSTVFLL